MPTGTTNYLLEGPNVVEETDVNGNLAASYVPNPSQIDDIVSFSRGGATYYPLTDALGSVYSLTDSAGKVTDTWSYDVYGVWTHLTGTSVLAYGFTGLKQDPDTGLQYARQRYRDPTSGGWLQPDRLGMRANANYYLYVGAQPTIARDPSGQIAIFDDSWTNYPTLKAKVQQAYDLLAGSPCAWSWFTTRWGWWDQYPFLEDQTFSYVDGNYTLNLFDSWAWERHASAYTNAFTATINLLPKAFAVDQKELTGTVMHELNNWVGLPMLGYDNFDWNGSYTAENVAFKIYDGQCLGDFDLPGNHCG